MQLASSLRQDLDRRGHRIQFPPRLDPGIQEEAWIPGSKTGSLGVFCCPDCKTVAGIWSHRISGITDSFSSPPTTRPLCPGRDKARGSPV